MTGTDRQFPERTRCHEEFLPADIGFSTARAERGREINWWTFAPRLGFAWDVHGDGKTSVRASAGMGYDYLNIQAHLWTSISPPFNYDVTVNNPRYDDPWATYPGGHPFPAVYDTNANFTSFGGITAMPYHLDPSQSQNWNLSIQRQLGNDFVVSASYLGNHVVHMLITAPLNPAIYFPGVADANGNCFAQGYTFTTTRGAVCSTTTNTNSRRILSLVDFQRTGRFVGALAEYQSAGKLSYNGMLLDVRKRAGRGSAERSAEALAPGRPPAHGPFRAGFVWGRFRDRLAAGVMAVPPVRPVA
ncbi:MAG: hypothetical protein HYU27_07220 [Acidobacteria bacterium]|nr:hypothetical protein [Acidobacteriota bacterium]